MNKNLFPFKTSLSLHKLVEFWKSFYETDSESFNAIHSKRLISEMEKIPDLGKTISDLSILRNNKQLVNTMMSAVFPAAHWDSAMMAVMKPYSFEPFYCTPKFEEMFVKDGEISVNRLNLSKEMFEMSRAIGAYTELLRIFYNIDLKFIYPMIISITDDETGLERYFKMNFSSRFMDIKVNGELPEITEDQIKLFSENMMNLDIWTEILPPDLFEFTGFVSLNMIEVTEQEAISKIKYDLLDRNVLATREGFDILQQNFRVLFRNPNLSLGLASVNADKSMKIKNAKKIINSFLLDEDCLSNCSTYEGSIYETAINGTDPVIIYDLNDFQQCTEIENNMKKKNIRNIFLMKLVSNQETIGILEVASPISGDINSVNALKLNEVLPLLTIAVKNAAEDLENRIQAVIKEKCTAIHPAVEWRFRDAALNLIESQTEDPFAEMEEIVFKDVYPLYGLSDIRDSSTIRNRAILDDLLDNLSLAKDILLKASDVKNLPILDQMIYRINKRSVDLGKGLHTGDEASIVNFLHKEVEPVFSQLKNFSKSVKASIDNYFRLMNPRNGVYYNKRKEYEQSVSIINESISTFVKDEEEKAQKMFPHYFERYKTDGVEYTIYIGESISRNQKFDNLFLRNMRLWQLLLMCAIATRSSMLREKLPVKLETANLILVQDRPLTIRFHLDQKKFDVDGTYNAHYEIMKKRIDKAEIKGSEERLTQPGKIAIIYTQNSEAAEYKQYLEYLQFKGIIGRNIEELDLEDLQGVYGLKALRVSVITRAENIDKTKQELKKTIAQVKELYK